MKKIALVVTTVHEGKFLYGYVEEARREKVLERVIFFVIPDVNTPIGCWENCIKLREQGADVRYVLLQEQDEFLNDYGIKNLIPYHSDNRRNVGYLMALQSGAETIISIDDDNFNQEGEDFFLSHETVTRYDRLESRTAKNKWISITGRDEFPRGFPYYARREPIHDSYSIVDTQSVMMNAGLWTKEPDFDAITWMHMGQRNLFRIGKTQSYVLGANTWTPINSQNTAINHQVMPCYYFLPMGATINHQKIDRYGDIFSGYFAEACVHSMGHKIRIGTPEVEHIRNSHHYIDDLAKELSCIEMLEDMLPWLTDINLQGSTYTDKYQSLINQLENQIEKFENRIWNIDAKSYWHRNVYCMNRWLEVCKKIGSQIKEKELVCQA